MIVSTTENLAGYRVKQTLGQTFGVVVRSRGLAGNIAAALRSLIGGEIKEYTQLLEEARRHAVDRMVQNAQAMGANPGTGKLVEVDYDPQTGERRYRQV
jgi:uncharacterized protein YbjQ (UPF0145 family)